MVFIVAKKNFDRGIYNKDTHTITMKLDPGLNAPEVNYEVPEMYRGKF